MKILTGNKHPSVCYQCESCRLCRVDRGAKNSKSIKKATESSGFKNRLTNVEDQIMRMQELIKALQKAQKKTLSTLAKPIYSPSQSATSIRQGGLLVDKISYADVTSSGLQKSEETALETKPLRLNKMTKKGDRSKRSLSVICTNVSECNETLLANKQKHDERQWLELCSQMSLGPIQPISLIRLSRPAQSLHMDKPRLLKIVVETEKELEDILLSAYLLRDAEGNKTRVFADIPYAERIKQSQQEKQPCMHKDQNRSLIILNVPEDSSDSSKSSDIKHDLEQWKYISDSIQASNEAAVDIYRIPKSPNYHGDGPRPLKVTLLTSTRADALLMNWNKHRNLLPKEMIFIQKTIATTIEHDKVTQNTPVTKATMSKNAELPAPTESAAQQ